MDKEINDSMPAAAEEIAASASPPRNDDSSMEEKARKGHLLYENLKEIIAKRTGDVFALGKILKTIRDDKLYEAMGYDTFLEFCASPELAFHKTVAYTYIQLHETYILKFGLSFQEIGNIPYSKLVTVMKYANEENIKSMIALARELPSSDLDEEILALGLKRDESGDPAEYKTRGQRLFDKYKKLPAADKVDFDREYRWYNKIPDTGGQNGR